jgi:hypothetical protein
MMPASGPPRWYFIRYDAAIKDQFGDGYFFKNPMVVYRILKGEQEQADRFYYDARSNVTGQDPSVDD